jgi:hypothetical protein
VEILCQTKNHLKRTANLTAMGRDIPPVVRVALTVYHQK